LWKDSSKTIDVPIISITSVGDKFDPAHLQKCTKRNKPQVNALVVNALDVDLIEETLNQQEMEDVLAEEMGQLLLNALYGTEMRDSMRIRAWFTIKSC
jgi:hypothetical protein